MKKVRSALNGVEGVKKAKVKMGSATVIAKPEVETKKLITALKKAGYEASVKKKQKEKKD